MEQSFSKAKEVEITNESMPSETLVDIWGAVKLGQIFRGAQGYTQVFSGHFNSQFKPWFPFAFSLMSALLLAFHDFVYKMI